MIVTGDATQIDLPDPAESGLIDAVRRLRRIRGIGFVAMDKSDIVRHRLVQRIVAAYENKREQEIAAERGEEVARLLAEEGVGGGGAETGESPFEIDPDNGGVGVQRDAL